MVGKLMTDDSRASTQCFDTVEWVTVACKQTVPVIPKGSFSKQLKKRIKKTSK